MEALPVGICSGSVAGRQPLIDSEEGRMQKPAYIIDLLMPQFCEKQHEYLAFNAEEEPEPRSASLGQSLIYSQYLKAADCVPTLPAPATLCLATQEPATPAFQNRSSSSNAKNLMTSFLN